MVRGGIRQIARYLLTATSRFYPALFSMLGVPSPAAADCPRVPGATSTGCGSGGPCLQGQQLCGSSQCLLDGKQSWCQPGLLIFLEKPETRFLCESS